MNVMNYIPHRLLINHSLKKESDKMKSKLDSYQIEYERKMKECQNEIDKAQIEKNADLERIREKLNQELNQDQKLYEGLFNELVDYSNSILQRKYLYTLRKNKSAQAVILNEDIYFLKSQMNEIGTEIKLIRKRKSALSAFTNVHDIIDLANDCGYEISFSYDDDADNLLRKVNEAIDNCSDDKIKRVSLIRLRGIIYERSEYLSTIKYLQWVIEQKVEYSKQIKAKKESLVNQLNSVEKDIKSTDTEISRTSQEIERKAEQIRFFWMRPIAILNAKIDYDYQQKKTCFKNKKGKQEKRKCVGDELHRMATSHSNDQNKWEHLQKERKILEKDIDDLNQEINKLDSAINSKKEERKSWYEKREKICSIAQNNKIHLIVNNLSAISDENRIITSRLNELEQIRIDGIAEAESKCQQEKDELIIVYSTNKDTISKKLTALLNQQTKIETDINTKKAQFSIIEKQIKKIKENDKRSIFLKVVTKLPELTAAIHEKEGLKADIAQLSKKKTALINEINKKKSEKNDLDRKHEQSLDKCIPILLHPTKDEKREEEMLKLRLKNIQERLQWK